MPLQWDLMMWPKRLQELSRFGAIWAGGGTVVVKLGSAALLVHGAAVSEAAVVVLIAARGVSAALVALFLAFRNAIKRLAGAIVSFGTAE